MTKARRPDKLAQDAMAARAAGMTYGKWKALEYEKRQMRIEKEKLLLADTEEEPREPKTYEKPIRSRIRYCVYCGTVLGARHRRYCGDKCRRLYNMLDAGKDGAE